MFNKGVQFYQTSWAMLNQHEKKKKKHEYKWSMAQAC